MSSKKVLILGGTGLVGSAVARLLCDKGNCEVSIPTRSNLNLLKKSQVDTFFKKNTFDEVYLCAAKVGGIIANQSTPTQFLVENLEIQNNVMTSVSLRLPKAKLLFLGSSCIYPRQAPQPIKEDYLLTGSLEKTNSAYAVAKIAGVQLCASTKRELGRDFRAIMPTNLYGPNDNFDDTTSHVIPGLMSRIHKAKLSKTDIVKVWGTGTPLREFLFVDDLAKLAIRLMSLTTSEYDVIAHPDFNIVNVGSNEEVSIRGLAEKIKATINYEGTLIFDADKPDGTPRKKLCIDRLKKLGDLQFTSLEEGLRLTYLSYKRSSV